MYIYIYMYIYIHTTSVVLVRTTRDCVHGAVGPNEGVRRNRGVAV